MDFENNTFRLHSNPDSKHTIYLDFDGHVTENTEWNDSSDHIESPAYDVDGDPNNFSDAEKAEIRHIWQRVAEDFAPFNVNVTTEEPNIEDLRNTGNGDDRWGIRAVVTRDDDTRIAPDSGGIALLSSFNDNVDTPAFVFNDGESGAAETISHEVGHTLGLEHDGPGEDNYYLGHGSGNTSWGTIMGDATDRSVTQWSKGEYFNATNGEDDLTIITTGNGFTYRVDDYGNDNATAFNLNPTNVTSISAFGIIEQNTDIDVFSFVTGTGNVSFNIDPSSQVYISGDSNPQYLDSRGANLDILARIYSNDGTLVAESNPVDSLFASFENLSLDAGKYYIHIDGVGRGNPFSSNPDGYTEYGSLGQYRINGTVIAPPPPNNIVSISAVDNVGTENGDTAIFRVTRTGDTSNPLTVNYNLSGTATNGTDYNSITQTVTIAAGNDSADITINPTDDNLIEGSENITLTLIDGNAYDLGSNTTDTVTISDNDTAGITVTQSNGSTNITEGGASDTYNLVLNSQPSANVTVTINNSSNTSTDITTLTFTTANWNVAQTVTVKAVDDNNVEGNHTADITHTVTSTDSNYNNLTVNPVSVNITDNDTANTDINVNNNNIFTINNNTQTDINLLAQLTGRTSSVVNEVGFFVVEDDQGTITDSNGNQLTPSDGDAYIKAALSSNQTEVIFSAIANSPNGFNQNQRSRILEDVETNQPLVFYFVENATTDGVVNGGVPTSKVQLGSTFASNTFSPLQVSDLGNDKFSLAWSDNMILNIEATQESNPLGSSLQGKQSAEIIDLTQLSNTDTVTADFTVHREAAYRNTVYFYQVDDINGSVGNANPGDANYQQAALNNIVTDVLTGGVVEFASENQGTQTGQAVIKAGSLLAPMIVINDNINSLLDSNPNNDPTVYFPYLGSNSDGVDHIRLLNDNTFGFEDLAFGGDLDYNDIIVSIDFKV